MRQAVGIAAGFLCLWTFACACAAASDREEVPLVYERGQQCVADHPASQSEMDQALASSGASADCSRDDGACQASPECTGTLEGRECEPDTILGVDAAICIALAGGIAEGLHGLSGELSYDFALRRIVWNVHNVLTEETNGAASGRGLAIDAVNGYALDTFSWTRTP